MVLESAHEGPEQSWKSTFSVSVRTLDSLLAEITLWHQLYIPVSLYSHILCSLALSCEYIHIFALLTVCSHVTATDLLYTPLRKSDSVPFSNNCNKFGSESVFAAKNSHEFCNPLVEHGTN